MRKRVKTVTTKNLDLKQTTNSNSLFWAAAFVAAFFLLLHSNNSVLFYQSWLHVKELSVRILVLEDNETLALGISHALSSAGYAVDVLNDGLEGRQVLEYEPYDLLVLDLGLPHLDGMDLLKNLRKQRSKLPVLIISARDKLDQKILGLESGADDYLCKPFALEEVVARVNALLRRALQNGQSRITIGDLSFDTTTRTLTCKDERVELSSRETSIFEQLLLHANHVLSKENIASHIAAFDDDFNPTAIETYISRLRKKLGESVVLQTVRGLGYILITKKQ
jgi:DNA-binding response OmpR family regulator